MIDTANQNLADVVFSLAKNADPAFPSLFASPISEVTQEIALNSLKKIQEDAFSYSLTFHKLIDLETALIKIKQSKKSDLGIKKTSCFFCLGFRKNAHALPEEEVKKSLDSISYHRKFRHFAQTMLLKPGNLPDSIDKTLPYFTFDLNHKRSYNNALPNIPAPKASLLDASLQILKADKTDPLIPLFQKIIDLNKDKNSPWHQSAFSKMQSILKNTPIEGHGKYIFSPLREAVECPGMISSKIDYLYEDRVLKNYIRKMPRIQDQLTLALSLFKEEIFRNVLFEGDTFYNHKQQQQSYENRFRAIVGRKVGLQDNLACLDPASLPQKNSGKIQAQAEDELADLIHERFWKIYNPKKVLDFAKKWLSEKIKSREIHRENLYEGLILCGWEPQDYEHIMTEDGQVSFKATLALLILSGVLNTEKWKTTPWIN